MTADEKYQVMVKIKLSDLSENEKSFALESMLASLHPDEANLALAGLMKMQNGLIAPPAEVA
ncbi:hypothetical protein K0W35_001185 [Vibrio parahaemolyticus]|nr:hypothetical protein [Vibrio parahaemolyticus]